MSRHISVWSREDIRSSRVRRFAVRIVAASYLVASGATVASALTADSADDICSPSADPCEVTDMVKVAPGSVLDFGLRAVSVTGNGGFNFGAGSGQILCGPFEASTGTAIDANGFDDGALDSGAVTIEARRACSGDLDRPCMVDANCSFGTCSARRCSDGPTRTCSSDASCQLGTCGFSGRCSLSPVARCTTNAECDLGTCPAQLTCSQLNLHCSSNADCGVGTCDVGEGSISMDGAIQGSSAFPAHIKLAAAGSVSITKPVNLTSRSRDADAGELEVESRTGSVTISDKIRARGGSLSRGGVIKLFAAEDVVLEAKVNLNGGDFDGGTLEIEADRDIRIEDSVLASSTNGSGWGGILTLSASGDIVIGGAGLRSRIALHADGHFSREFPGDGGIVEMFADGDIVIPSHVSLSADGARSGGGGEVYLAADGDIAFDGYASASVSGKDSYAGVVDLDALGTLTVGSTASIEVLSGAEGGTFLMYGGDGVDYAGAAELTGALETFGGGARVRADSRGDMTLSGTLSLYGERPDVDVWACRIALTETGAIRSASGGDTKLNARESMRLFAGSVIETQDGTNLLRYRTADKPPVVEGTVTPAATLEVTGGTGCAVCGNSEIDYLETCDDGNVVDGDGCSSLCLME